MKRGKRRKTLAFQITNLGDNYISLLWPGVVDIARERDANLIIFHGSGLNSPTGYNYQQNMIYEYINHYNADALIMTTGTLCNYVERDVFDKFYKRLLPIPLVSINVRLDNIPSIIIDNKSGMKEAVAHLIKVHGFRRIAFIRGPAANPEAAARYEAYLEVLKENGIEADERLIVQGNFLPSSGSEAVKQLIDERKCRVEAIVSANDDMALSLMEALKERKIKIPDNVAVTGFDDIELAHFSSPPLTTVHQPLYQQARLAGMAAIDMLEGKKVPMETVLPTKLIIRSSCGCFSESIGMVKTINVLSTGQPENSSAVLWEECRHNILAEVGKLLDAREIESRGIMTGLQGIFDIFEDGIVNEEVSDKFLRHLTRILYDENASIDDIRIWQDILSIIIDNLHMVSPFFQGDMYISPLFHKARILISESHGKPAVQPQNRIIPKFPK